MKTRTTPTKVEQALECKVCQHVYYFIGNISYQEKLSDLTNWIKEHENCEVKTLHEENNH